MKKYLLALILLTGFFVTLSRLGFGGLPIEGTWTATGGDNEFGWYLTYNFKAGEYSLEGYPPLSETGSYTVLFVNESTYTVLIDPADAEPYLSEFRILEDDSMVISNYSASGGTKYGLIR